MKKVLNGNANAFSYFVMNYKDYAYSLSYAILRNNYLAEEAVQEAFIKAFEKLRTFKQDAKFKTWFGRIVINESFRRSKSEKESISIDEVPESEIKSMEGILKSLLHEEQRFYISSALEKLRADEALAIKLFYLKESSLKEICEMTDWSIPKTKMLLLRGRNSLYISLKKLLKSNLKELM